MSKRAPTAQDVARRAGVSRSAVSLVLNGQADGNVAKESQDRIRKAAEELNYVPNPVAVSLRNRRTTTIGIVTDVLTSPFAGRLMEGAHRASRGQGFFPLVIAAGRDSESIEEAASSLLTRRVDGLLIAAESMHEVRVPRLAVEVPVVFANCVPTGEPATAYVPDEIGGSRAAAEHLLGLGHREIVLAGGSRDVLAVPLRAEGFLAALTAAGVDGAGRVVPVGWDIEDGFRAVRTILERRPATTAVMCANDRVALGLLLGAASLGLRVPEDLSVIGYDDEERIASRAVPALTTVALPHEEMGVSAVKALIAEVLGRGDAGAVVSSVPCRLVPRSSTAAPRPV